MKIWVSAATSPDPNLAGKSICRKRGVGPVRRYFTEQPEEVEETGDILRLLVSGDLVRRDPPVAPTENKEQEP